MDKEKYLSDIQDIKAIMNRSSRFISLSGLAGISAGVFALLGAFTAYQRVYMYQDNIGYRTIILTSPTIVELLLIAAITLICSLLAGVYFTVRQSKKSNKSIWDRQVRNLLLNLSIPLVAGGLLCLLLLLNGQFGIIAPLTLIFYGLALVNASHYTFGEVKSLGIIQIGLGLLATYFIGYGLLFWAIGFGLFHIVYGLIMHYRYNS